MAYRKTVRKSGGKKGGKKKAGLRKSGLRKWFGGVRRWFEEEEEGREG